jgi:hypothetical protein
MHSATRWDTLFEITWNAFCYALTLLAVILVVIAPTVRFRRGWTSKVGWILVVTAFGIGTVAGYLVPLGPVAVLVIRPWRRRPAQIVNRDPLGHRYDVLPRRYLDGPPSGETRKPSAR